MFHAVGGMAVLVKFCSTWSPAHLAMVKVVFLAKGSRGDVEPLLALCLAIT